MSLHFLRRQRRLSLNEQTSTAPWLIPDFAAFWPCNEGTGTTLYDQSVNKNNLTFVGGQGWGNGVNGASGDAISLSGGNYANLMGFPPLYTGGDMTFCCWVKTSIFQTDGSYCGLMDYGKSGNVIYTLSLVNSPANTVRSEVQNSGGSYQNTTDGAISLNTWYHMALTINGSINTVYVNGVGSSAGFGGPPKSGDSSFNISLGRDWYSSETGRFFLGSISRARIYNRALSLAEIQILYHAQQ